MKKKKFFMAFAVILALVCGRLTRISAYADFDSIESRGNFILSGEELSIHASDMVNLKLAIRGLYDELPSVIGVKASAAGIIREDDIQSKGIINYGNGAVVLDSADFYLLAEGINNLESQYKANVAAALKEIKTYFKPDGSIVHEQETETLSPGDAAGLPFDVICNGILGSQSVDHLDVAPAAENNISAGAAAWVNGRCIIGTGQDVNDAYDQGYDQGYSDGGEDGYNRGYNDGDEDGYERGCDDGYRQGYADGYADHAPDDARIEYIKHKHTGDSVNGGGCYTWVNQPAVTQTCSHARGDRVMDGGVQDDVNMFVGEPWYGMSGYMHRVSYDPKGTADNCDFILKKGTYYSGSTIYHEGLYITGASQYNDGSLALLTFTYKDWSADGLPWQGQFPSMITHTATVTPGFTGYKLTCGMTEETIVGATIIWE